VSKSCFDLLTYKSKNRSRTVDTRFQNAAVTVSLSVLPIKAANMMIIDNSKQIALQLTHLQVQKSLTLC
jgi:hypothetical protein